MCWKRARSASSGTGGAGEFLGVPCALPGCLLGQGLVGVQEFTAHGVPRCERYGVVPLARMVQQNHYHPILPAEEPPGKGRTLSRTAHKQLRQELRAKLRRTQGRRPKTAQQPQGPGTPVSARDKAEVTTRHLAVQWGLEPGPATALTVSGQDVVGAEQGLGTSAYSWYGSIGSSPAPAQYGATPMPAVKGRKQQGELVLWAACAHCSWGGLRPRAGGVVLGVLLTSPHSSGPGRGCRCNKHLGKCEHRIAPHETRYQLHNVDSRILLHCNCTRRCESRRKRALCAYSWGSKQVQCLRWPAPADVCPPVPADWHGAFTGQRAAGT